jgi:glycerate kinase
MKLDILATSASGIGATTRSRIMSAGAAGGAAAAQAAIAQATKASGVIVRVDAVALLAVVEQNAEPLVVHAEGGFFSRQHQYLTSYRGLAFYARSPSTLRLPEHCQLIEAQKIWIPG